MAQESVLDPFAQLKETQKQAWSTFAPTEILTCMPAARLAAFARLEPGQRVLDVGCGTGVVALAAARHGARVTGIDLTPQLVARARENSAIAGIDAEWHEGDAEAMPFADASFDVVLSQFGHMFTPRPDVVTREMLRVLKPGGTLAFATWPPELYSGRMFGVVGRYLPPPTPGVASPPLWGKPDIVLERLGDAVKDVVFDRGVMRSPAVSPQHFRLFFETSVGPVMKVVQSCADDPARLAEFRRELDALIAEYFEPNENVVRQDYLLTRAKKA